jgi:hypothetical protein
MGARGPATLRAVFVDGHQREGEPVIQEQVRPIPSEASRSDQVVTSRLGPVLLAVTLSILSVPIVAIALVGGSNTACLCSGDGPGSLDWASAVAIALVAVLAAGIIGGSIGGRFVRRAPLWGLIIAVAVAWPVAIITLPVLPTILGVTFNTAYVCIDACSPQISAGEPLSGLTAYGQSLEAGVLLVVPAGLAIAFAIAAWVATRRNHVRVGAACALVAYASLNLWSDVGLPFLCLVVGAVIWVSPYWLRWERTRAQVAVEPSPAEAPLEDPSTWGSYGLGVWRVQDCMGFPGILPGAALGIDLHQDEIVFVKPGVGRVIGVSAAHAQITEGGGDDILIRWGEAEALLSPIQADPAALLALARNPDPGSS